MAYSSKYYDPVKAHEYYENYRKKGLKKGRSKKTPEEQALAQRKSTKGLNDMGKAAAEEVKEAIKAERKEIYKLIAQAVKDNIKRYREQLKSEGLDKEAIAEKVKEIRASVKEYKKKIKEIFQEKYLSELDKIKQDPEMRAVSKRRSRKK